MSDKSAIEWTDATWNPVAGCSKVSEGCRNCYAEALSLRFGRSKKPWSAQNAAENVVLHPERIGQPLKWRDPRRVFVNSMSDLFHDAVPFEFIALVWDVMFEADRHTFQILTKRPERMLEFADWMNIKQRRRIDYPNIWLGVSIELDRFSWRANSLRDTPAAVRFISAEPLLGPLPSLSLDGIDWIITGGESGAEHRPFDPAWAADLRDRCAVAGVAFFHKQNGGRTPKAGGRLLDGREHHKFPETRHSAAVS